MLRDTSAFAGLLNTDGRFFPAMTLFFLRYEW